ncbi:MAG: hypothetical protein C0471_05170 [Erythrobacter sp.]|nr:hypothetical protein [Erythrobacter sp.]
MSAGLMEARYICKAFRMSEEPRKNMSREERLAAKLRENLRRRKAQSRETSRALDESDAPTETLSNPPSAG